MSTRPTLTLYSGLLSSVRREYLHLLLSSGRSSYFRMVFSSFQTLCLSSCWRRSCRERTSALGSQLPAGALVLESGQELVFSDGRPQNKNPPRGIHLLLYLDVMAYHSCGLSVHNCKMSSPRNATRAATHPHRQQLQIADTRHAVTRERRRSGTSQTQSGGVGSQDYSFAPLPAWSSASLSTHN